MKIKTKVKVGLLSSNHNQPIRMKVKTNIKSGATECARRICA
jgi:hypothetical protein